MGAQRLPKPEERYRHAHEGGLGMVVWVATKPDHFKVCVAWKRDDGREESVRIVDGDLFAEQWSRIS